MKRPRLFALAALMGLPVLGCGAEPPVLTVKVTRVQGVPSISGLSRLQLLVQRCGDDAPLLDRSLPLRGEAVDPIELDLEPGTEFYVHLKGWVDCAGNPADVCVPPDQAGPMDCVCPTQSGDPARVLRAEGCSDWFTAESNQDEPISLGMPEGLCPPAPRTTCE